MEKELFIALCDQLKNKVPELRWIDSDQGQLNVSERPPVAFPCCLVEMSYPQCTTHMAGKQRVRVRFQLQGVRQTHPHRKRVVKKRFNSTTPCRIYTRRFNGGLSDARSIRHPGCRS
mgnify:CR=1 FL=1